MYGVHKNKAMVKKIDCLIRNLFAEYVIKYFISTESNTSSNLASNISSKPTNNVNKEDGGEQRN